MEYELKFNDDNVIETKIDYLEKKVSILSKVVENQNEIIKSIYKDHLKTKKKVDILYNTSKII